MINVGTACLMEGATGFTFCAFNSVDVPFNTEIFDENNQSLGRVSEMPGTFGGFTMIAFDAIQIPVGSSLWIS